MCLITSIIIYCCFIILYYYFKFKTRSTVCSNYTLNIISLITSNDLLTSLQQQIVSSIRFSGKMLTSCLYLHTVICL